MTSPAPQSHRRPLLALAVAALAVATLAGLGATGYGIYRVGKLTERATANEVLLQQIWEEVTRFRLEQSAGSQGPAALLTKLRTYAPMLVSARTTEPDFRAAQKEMDAVLRAFHSLGADAWPAIDARLSEISGEKNFDEAKWLLEAAVRVDTKAGDELAKNVLLGLRLPAPRLRWHAARILIEQNKQLAQTCLRQIMRTESSRGINLERAQAYHATIPDQAAFATSGFHNFVQLYVRSEDPQIDETLLMVIGRSEHDPITVQECVELLGNRHCERAVEAIERLYKNPPLQREDPLFLIKCVDALQAIQGAAARPFLEEALRSASTDTVAKHIQGLLQPGSVALPVTQPVAQPMPQPNSIAPPGKK